VPLSATHLIVRGRPAETDTEQHRAIINPRGTYRLFMLDGGRSSWAPRFVEFA
jgi:hypothetical protein